MKKLQVGSTIPTFELKDQNGKIFRSQEFLGKKNFVIYFYPKDETAGCTAEACSFRDDYEVFLEYDAEVIGISSDSETSHSDFARKYRLPFILLADTENKVKELFGVPRSFLGLLSGRTTYIVDKKGKIRHIYNSQIYVKKHVEEAINVLKKLQSN